MRAHLCEFICVNKNTCVFTSQPCPLPSFLRTLLHWCRNPGRKPDRRCQHVLTDEIAVCGSHPVARGTPPGTSQSADGHEGRPGRRFCALVQNQREDRELFRSWMDREVRAGEIQQPWPRPPTCRYRRWGRRTTQRLSLIYSRRLRGCGWPRRTGQCASSPC